jgi:hypothetical protein
VAAEIGSATSEERIASNHARANRWAETNNKRPMKKTLFSHRPQPKLPSMGARRKYEQILMKSRHTNPKQPSEMCEREMGI